MQRIGKWTFTEGMMSFWKIFSKAERYYHTSDLEEIKRYRRKLNASK